MQCYQKGLPKSAKSAGRPNGHFGLLLVGFSAIRSANGPGTLKQQVIVCHKLPTLLARQYVFQFLNVLINLALK